MPTRGIQQALGRLDDLTRRLRHECPWDRAQDERSIVPHTLEEAYELADAAHVGDDARLVDELGDVLFQVHFLALLLEERGAGDLGGVADHCAQKLIRRHPHVFADTQVQGAQEVLRNWESIKRGEPGREPGLFGEVPENLPGLLHARKVQRRAAASGFDFPGVEGPLSSLRDELEELEQTLDSSSRRTREPGDVRPDLGVSDDVEVERNGDAAAAPGPGSGESARPEAFHELGDVLFAAVNVARKLDLDPELALRAATERFRGRMESAVARADRVGERWSVLSIERQLAHYAAARLEEAPARPEKGVT